MGAGGTPASRPRPPWLLLLQDRVPGVIVDVAEGAGKLPRVNGQRLQQGGDLPVGKWRNLTAEELRGLVASRTTLSLRPRARRPGT